MNQIYQFDSNSRNGLTGHNIAKGCELECTNTVGVWVQECVFDIVSTDLLSKITRRSLIINLHSGTLHPEKTKKGKQRYYTVQDYSL